MSCRTRRALRTAKFTVLAAAVSGVVGVSTAEAAIRTWDGSQNSNWTVKKNWSSDTIPTSSDDVVFTTVGAGSIGSVPGGAPDVVSADFQSGTYDVSGLDTSGLFRISGGTISSGTYSGGSFLMSAGAITTSVFTTTGTFEQTGGTIANGTYTVGTLKKDVGTGAINNGTITVNTDYVATFGSGNSFVAKGGSTGVNAAATINAGGARNQTLTGTGVTNGATNSATFSLGAFREGNISTSKSLTINWGGDAAGPTLRGAVKTNTLTGGSGFTSTAADFTLVGNNSSTTHAVNLNLTGATAGKKLGGSMNVVNNFDDVLDQSVAVEADVYRYAAQQLNTTSANFGIAHVGDVVTAQSVSLSNTAANDGFSDSLGAAFGTMSGTGITTSGGPVSVAAGGNNTSMTVGINTATAGSRSGTVNIDFSSVPTVSGLDSPSLGSSGVTVTGQVNNYAAASLAKDSGDGSLTGGGTSYTLDLGAINQGAGTLAQILEIANVGGTTFTDLLDGSFNVSGAGSFNLSGFASFFSGGGIGGGSNLSGLQIALDGNLAPGIYTGNFIFTPRSTNAGGYDQPLASGPITVSLTGEVLAIPEPASGLFALSLGGLLLMGRRRRR